MCVVEEDIIDVLSMLRYGLLVNLYVLGQIKRLLKYLIPNLTFSVVASEPEDDCRCNGILRIS